MRLNQRGSSLIEVVISIVVIAVGVTGVFSVFSQTSKRSAEPVLLNQAQTIAEAYMNEILPQSFSPLAQTPTSRATFNDLDDYDNLADLAGPLDRSGTAIAGLNLEGFNIQVQITPTTLNNITVKQVLVTVTHDSWAIGNGNFNQSVVLVSHRASGL